MSHPRLQPIAFIVLQSAILAGVTWSVSYEWSRNGFVIGGGGQDTLFSSHYHGFPFAWRHVEQRLVTTWFTDEVVSNERVIDGENLAFPAVLFATALTVPWVAFTAFARQAPTRLTRYIRVVCLASIITLTFSIVDILTGESRLCGGYYNSDIADRILLNEHVQKLVHIVREKRWNESRDTQQLVYQQYSELLSRNQSNRTFGIFGTSIAVGLLIYRP